MIVNFVPSITSRRTNAATGAAGPTTWASMLDAIAHCDKHASISKVQTCTKARKTDSSGITISRESYRFWFRWKEIQRLRPPREREDEKCFSAFGQKDSFWYLLHRLLRNHGRSWELFIFVRGKRGHRIDSSWSSGRDPSPDFQTWFTIWHLYAGISREVRKRSGPYNVRHSPCQATRDQRSRRRSIECATADKREHVLTWQVSISPRRYQVRWRVRCQALSAHALQS